MVMAVMMDGAGAGGSLDAYKWKSRVIALFAQSADDPRLSEQDRIVAAMGQGAADRDIIVLKYTDAGSQNLRRQLGAPADGFAAVLIGKDGGAKLVSREPINAEKLAATIDAMPMRKDEMRKR
ncbi:MAG: DUF4174 domain-containing protein [Methylobacteriaceae bacterium]|nr:DUF4174 domain-containing protein [Methylobacteriaceae bacterium]